MAVLKPRREEHEQYAVVNWLKLAYPDILLAISPSGMKLPMSVAVKFKKMGLVRGIPDLMIFEPRHDYHGLFIELKKMKGGVVSKEQRAWLDGLTLRGYRAEVCRGFDEARKLIDWYLSGN